MAQFQPKRISGLKIQLGRCLVYPDSAGRQHVSADRAHKWESVNGGSVCSSSAKLSLDFRNRKAVLPLCPSAASVWNNVNVAGFLCRTHWYLQTGRQNQGRTLSLMVTQDLLLLLLHLHLWKNSQPLLWVFPVTGTGRISVPHNTELNMSSDLTVCKTIVNLSNSTKSTVRALKVKYMLLREVAQSNHSLGTVVTPKRSTNGLRVFPTLSCLLCTVRTI